MMGGSRVCPDGVESRAQLFAPLHCCQSSTSTFHTIRGKFLVGGLLVMIRGMIDEIA
jgi:hypothetical protein